MKGPGQVAQLVGVPSHAPKGFGFDPWSLGQGVNGRQLINVSLSQRCFSLSLPLPTSLKSIIISLGRGLDSNNINNTKNRWRKIVKRAKVAKPCNKMEKLKKSSRTYVAVLKISVVSNPQVLCWDHGCKYVFIFFIEFKCLTSGFELIKCHRLITTLNEDGPVDILIFDNRNSLCTKERKAVVKN